MTGVGQQRVSFDASALYAAVQDEREARGWSWRDLEALLGVRSSTTRRLRRTSPGADHDAELILRLATWTSRSVESFASEGRAGSVIATDPRAITLDGRDLLAFLDYQRSSLELSWRQTAAELQVGVRSLERLANGGRVRLRLLLQACRWTGHTVTELAMRCAQHDADNFASTSSAGS